MKYDCFIDYDIVGHSIRYDATNDSDKDSNNINDNNDNDHNVPGKSFKPVIRLQCNIRKKKVWKNKVVFTILLSLQLFWKRKEDPNTDGNEV